MHSPPGSQEEELIIYDEDITNLENIPLVTSMETQSELVEAEDQNSEEPAISFVDMPFESALATSSSTLKTSDFPKQTSESNEMFQRLPHDYIVPSKLSLKMSQNTDTTEHSINEFIESFSPYTTENDTVKPEISFDLKTPYIFYVDTDTTASNSSSATKKSGSINPFTQKYKKSVKIRTYRNPDGSVTEEKKIVEHNLTSSKGNVDKSALYSSDEDDIKFDDKYFDSMFNEMPSEFVEDDFNFLPNKKKRINCGSCSRKTKSEKIQIREPMADLQLKTSISNKVVSPKADNASNESHWSVSYAHSDIKQSRPGKEYCKEIEKVLQYNKSSDTTLISRKCKSEKINTNSLVANTQLKTSISNKVVSTKIENENDDVPLRGILNDIKLNSEKSRKGIEKEIQLETNDRDLQTSSIATIRSKSVNKKDNIVTRSTSIDEIPIKNEATITDQSNMSETTQILELKKKIKEEFDKLISRTGKKPGQTHFDKFCRKIYEKHGIQLKQIQPNMNDSKKPLEQKPNDIEGIEANTLKDSEREIQVLQEILNRIKLRTKVDVKEEQYNSDSINKIEPKSEDATSSVRESLEQYGNKLLNAMEYIKEGVINMFSRENSKHSARIEKSGNGVISKPDNIKTREKKAFGSTEIEEHKGGNVKSHGVKILDSSLSEDSIIKTAVEKFNKRGIQIWDSEDDPEGVVQSAISKFNEEQRRPENMKENIPKKREDPKKTFKEKQSKPKEEKKPIFVIKEIEIVDKHISTKIIPESTAQKELRAFRSSHPDKTTTDSDVTSKSEGYTREEVTYQRTDNSKGEVTMLNDTFAADEEKLDEQRKTVQSEQDKKSVSIPGSETSTKSHFKGKITRIKQKGHPDKVELQSVYKEVSTSSHVSEASKLAPKQSSSVQKDGNVFVTKQEESKDDGVSVIKQEESKDDNISVTVEKESKDDNVSLTKQKNSKVDSAIDLKQMKAKSEECKRKIIICEKCLMALSGFIPAKIVKETKVSADCQLCCMKEKQKEALKMPICSDFVIAEEDSSFSSSSDSCCKDTWNEKYPCCIPYKDQKLVAFHDTSYNKILESKVNDKFVTTPNPSTFIPGKPGVSTAPTEPKVATVPTASSEHSFAEMLVKSFARLLGIEQYRKQEPEKQTIAMESPCQSQEICDSYESETSDTPCPNKCTREAATSTKSSTRYDVRHLRDFPPFKKGLVKNDSGCSKCIDSDIALDIARTKDVLLGLESSDSLENNNKNTHTEIIYSKYVCKNKKT